ncbi:hypothetical protein AAP_00824 [Ascosphaera apis ARSEF 7405]|uniref:Uncharacterized protein n=1 Tax=Ascosphaera apis ARSEF 7405 TaxID=392613 RepID=A0A168CZ36_9EURO|nr:hypothetical protein AAP_00824 [Ascosphaera apis ARSEF 7405]
MADQGDPVEDDLFADLYDVDESAPQQPAASATAATATAASASVPSPSPAPATSAVSATPAAATPAAASIPNDSSSAAPSNPTLSSDHPPLAASAPFTSQPNLPAHDTSRTGAVPNYNQYSHENTYTIGSNTASSAMPQNVSTYQITPQQETSQIASVAGSDQPQGTGIKEDG